MSQVETRTVTQPDLVGFISKATGDVFSMMLGLEIAQAPSFIQSAVQSTASPQASGIVSLVGLAGDWVGSGSISCSAAFACRISAALLSAEFEAVNEDVLDAIAELTNMIIGNVKTLLEERLGPMGLSVPTVIYGRNFQTRSGANHQWVVVPFDCEADRLHVQICLVPNREQFNKGGRYTFPMPHMLNL